MINDYELTEALRSCVLAIRCERGRFYPDKDYGSSISQLENYSNRRLVLALARQAVGNIDGVFIKNVSIASDTATFEVYINNEREQVVINLEQNV